MKFLLLIDGSPNQAALAHKLAEGVDVAGIVVSRNVVRRKKPPAERARILVNRVGQRLVGSAFVRAWSGLMARYRAAFPSLPPVPTASVDNVNDDGTLDMIARVRPDYVLVSGTNLVGRRVIHAASERGGILNLHTGVSPYVKGGPNCTNWCLATGDFHLIGNTIMWLDLGIDTGALIATERTPLTGQESLDELHWSVMEHAHDLYRRVALRVAKGRPVPRVPQREIASGRTFYTREWDPFAIARAQWNFRTAYAPLVMSGPRLAEKLRSVRLVSLDAANRTHGEHEAERRV